jgi:uncharacterized protein (TIGR02680 family)
VAEARQKDAELKLAEHRDLAARRAEEAALSDLHTPLDRMLQSSATPGARGILHALLGRREQVLLRLAERTREVHSAQKEEERAAERLREAIERQKQQVETLRDEERKHVAARESFAAQLSAWAEKLQVLPLDREPLLDAAPADARRQADAAAESARRSLEDEAAPLHGSAREVERELGAVEAQRQELQARTYQPPCPPSWRSERPAERAGAPLYLLCDFGGGDVDQQANVEAALEAAGLLDAWMMPDGTVLGPESDDAVLLSSAVPPRGPTLRSILRPVEEAPVAVCVIDAVLGSIGLADVADAHPEATCWVSVDGRFRNGPLEGSHRKAAAEYIGAANRERQRLLRLAELDARRATLEARQGELRAALESVRARRDRVDEELRSFPDASPVLEADVRVQTARSMLEAARAARTRAQDSFDQHEARSREAISARERFAVEQGLRAWVDSVEMLKERTLAYQLEAERLLSQAISAEGARRARDECEKEWDAASRRWQAAAEEAEEAQSRSRRATAHAQAIKDAHGATRDEVLGQVRGAESRRSEAEGEIKERRKQKTSAEQSAIRAEVAAKTAETSVTECEDRRRSAEVSMRALVARGLTAAAGLELAMAGAAELWSYTDLLLAARRVDERLAATDPSETARDKALNKVAAEHQTLARMLRADLRVLPEQRDGIVEYQALWNGRVYRLLDLSSELEGEVAARDRLLSEREHELFESFLSGEAHQHLRARLRAAFDLVSRMTGQLEAHPTSSGMMLKLHWAVAEEAPAGTREAVDLLLKSGELLTDDNRAALASFLKERLAEARRDEQAGTLLDRLLEVLDYRRWHKFTVKYKTAQHDWRTLTRKAHQTGSGGQKAVMLHVPLFAAAAAFYESAAKTSPRLILLDEAFAGIDKETRGQLMGLLSEFDLDFMMTSFEEWGFYSQLDGLSTYNLSREQGMRGVHAEWFLWDGREAMHVEAL